MKYLNSGVYANICIEDCMLIRYNEFRFDLAGDFK